MAQTKPTKDRPFVTHRALHFLLEHVKTQNPELGKEAFLLQEEMDNAYSQELAARQQQAAAQEPKKEEPQA
jgi:hypothetical protein